MARKCYVVSGTEIRESLVNLSQLPEINGQINVDVQSGLLYQHVASGATIRTSEIGPNGYLASHRSEGTACIQVLSGSGVTGLVDGEGNTLCEISLSAGDLITFEDNMPLHFYRAGGAGMTYIAISFPASGQK